MLKKCRIGCLLVLVLIVLLWFLIADRPYYEARQLMSAIGDGDIVKLEELLENGYSPNVPNWYYKGIWKILNGFLEISPIYPLSAACSKGDPQLVQLLLDYGADPLLTEQEDFGWSALSSAILASEDEDCVQIVKMLIANGANIDNTGDYYLPAVLASAEYPHLSYYTEEEAQLHAERIVELVILLMGDMDVNSDGGILLWNAAKNGNLPLVKYLLSIGADPTVEKEDGGTAYDIAMMWEYYEVAEYLMQWMAERP